MSLWEPEQPTNAGFGIASSAVDPLGMEIGSTFIVGYTPTDWGSAGAFAGSWLEESPAAGSWTKETPL